VCFRVRYVHTVRLIKFCLFNLCILGVGIKATEAISAAIFAFLYCLAERQPNEVKHYNKVEQAIFYAISLGGDTDTIATMTGAIAGALWGHTMIPDHWLKHFEGKNLVEDLAVKLHDECSKQQNETQLQELKLS